MDAEEVSSADLAGLTELVSSQLLIWLLIKGSQEITPVLASPEVCLDVLSVWQLCFLRAKDTCDLLWQTEFQDSPQYSRRRYFGRQPFNMN